MKGLSLVVLVMLSSLSLTGCQNDPHFQDFKALFQHPKKTYPIRTPEDKPKVESEEALPGWRALVKEKEEKYPGVHLAKYASDSFTVDDGYEMTVDNKKYKCKKPYSYSKEVVCK